MNDTEKITDYRDLDVWKFSMELSVDVYRATSRFPNTEMYGLTAQMRRASVSIASNIAEGYGRETTAAFIQFLRIAQGSLKELETQTMLAERLNFLGQDPAKQQLEKITRIGKMLNGLIRSLMRRGGKQ
ncbi:MAG: four helix bundle protein [Aquisalinus sp.]|nr:four helix bundle protein [Aquisalinus sp.]